MSEGFQRHPEGIPDPEKGGLDNVLKMPDNNRLDTAISLNSDKEKEKGSVVTTTVKEVVASPPPAKSAPAKPKRKVSKWLRFRLWFNMYR